MDTQQVCFIHDNRGLAVSAEMTWFNISHLLILLELGSATCGSLPLSSGFLWFCKTTTTTNKQHMATNTHSHMHLAIIVVGLRQFSNWNSELESQSQKKRKKKKMKKKSLAGEFNSVWTSSFLHPPTQLAYHYAWSVVRTKDISITSAPHLELLQKAKAMPYNHKQVTETY